MTVGMVGVCVYDCWYGGGVHMTMLVWWGGGCI